MTFVASDLALRLYNMHKNGVPLPTFSEDDVVNYVVTEAVILRGLQDEKERAERQEREEWKRRPVGEGKLRGGVPRGPMRA